MKEERKIRVLVAKPGLDGHDRGAKVLVLALREAGMEVIYTGRHLMLEQIVACAIQEDVDVIGLSILSGSHLTLAEALIKQMRDKGLSNTPVVLGGVIPQRDIPKLQEMGVKGVFPNGASLLEVSDFIVRCAHEKHNKESSSKKTSRN